MGSSVAAPPLQGGAMVAGRCDVRETQCSSPSPTGRGVGVRVRRRDYREDRLNHSIQRKQHIVIPKAQHDPAFRLKPPRPCLIEGCLMLRSVQLNNHLSFNATKVCDVRCNRMLPSELEALELIPTRTAPKCTLCLGHVATRCTGVGTGDGRQWRFDFHRSTVPSPQPLSRGERGFKHVRFHGLFLSDSLVLLRWRSRVLPQANPQSRIPNHQYPIPALKAPRA